VTLSVWPSRGLMRHSRRLRAQYAGAVRIEFKLRDLLIVFALMGIGSVLWVVLLGPAALVLFRPAS
jgi:hypothetical protein